MGLSIIKGSTGHARWLTIVDDFEVEVRHRTKVEQEQFTARWRNAGAGQFAKECAEFFLAGARGLTAPAARKIGVPLKDDQETGEDGAIETDQSVLADVWRHAYPDKFANPITLLSADMLAAIELEKEQAKND